MITAVPIGITAAPTCTGAGVADPGVARGIAGVTVGFDTCVGGVGMVGLVGTDTVTGGAIVVGVLTGVVPMGLPGFGKLGGVAPPPPRPPPWAG